MTDQTRPAVKILVRRFPNPQFRQFHADADLTLCRATCSAERGTRGLARDVEWLAEAGPVGHALMDRLLSTTGVTTIFLDPESVSIAIGELFSWRQLQPVVLDALAGALDRPVRLWVVTTSGGRRRRADWDRDSPCRNEHRAGER